MPEPQPPVDYDKLAAEHGGTTTTDYDRLAQQQGGTPNPAPVQSPAESWVQTLSKFAPVVGSIAGGIAGGPIGAGLGGMYGEAIRQSANPGPSAKQNLASLATEGALSAAGEKGAQLATQAVGAVAPNAARWLMDRAFNPTDRLAREFPNLSDTAIEHAISISKGGMEKARELLRAAKGVANGAIAKADANGATVALDDATAGLQTTLQKIMSSSDIGGDLQTLGRVEREIAVGRKPTLTLTEADQLKTQLQQEARAAYQRFRAPNGTPAMGVEAEAKKDMAAALNAAIDRAATLKGAPGYAAANGEAQELIGVNRAMARATRSGPNVVRMMVRPGMGAMVGGGLGMEEGHPALGAIAGAYATSPASMSRLAILLGHPIAQQMLKQVPRPLLQAILDQVQPTATRTLAGEPPQ